MGRLRRGRLRILLRRALHTSDSTRRTAVAVSLGVFLGCSPFFGVHTLLALGLAFLFRLNRVAVLGGTLILNPWTIVPIYAAGTSLGMFLWDGRPGELPALRFSEVDLLHPSSLIEAFSRLGPYLISFLLGNLVLAVAAAAAAYPLSFYLIGRFRAVRAARRRRAGSFSSAPAPCGDPPADAEGRVGEVPARDGRRP